MAIKGSTAAVLLALAGFVTGAPCAARDMRDLEAFPGDMARGAWEEIHPEGLLTLAVAGAGASITRYGNTAYVDDYRTAATLKRKRPLGVGVTDFGAVIGYPVYLMGAMGVTYLGSYAGDARGGQEFGLLGFEALALSGIEVEILKSTVPRLRPDSTVDRTDPAAFPSGHTAASFSLATVAASKWGWRVGAPAYVAAGFVGYSRMEGGKHYLSDVLFGAGLGIACGRAVFKVRRREKPAQYAITPFLTPGGAGVEVYF